MRFSCYYGICAKQQNVDFEDAIFDGLKYFYSRLNIGGYNFAHAYNSCTLKGVKNAVKKYEMREVN